MAKVKKIEIECPCGYKHTAYNSKNAVELEQTSGEYNCPGCGQWVNWVAGKIKGAVDDE